MKMSRISAWDADFIPFYVCHNKKDQPEKSMEDCFTLADQLITNVNKSIGSSEFVGFLTKGKCFRYKIYPDYKGNRKYLDLPKYINETKSYIENKYNFYSEEGYEADDLVVSYKKCMMDNYENIDVIIVSPDKDILNLEGTHYNPKKNEFVTCLPHEAELYFWKSMMIGDTADNIKGIKGIGESYASKIIEKQQLFSSLKATVLDKYCEIYGESLGIDEFYKNYKCLKIVNDYTKVLTYVKYNKTELNSEPKEKT